MFVCTLKWNKKTALMIILITALVLCLLIVAIGLSGRRGGCKAETNEERIEFLQSLGWEVEPDPMDFRDVVIPKEFSPVYEQYNDLQKAQGYDLSKFCGQSATLYTYRVTNYTGYDGNVVAELYVIDGRIAGGDVHSLELDGFMHGLSKG